MNVKKCECFAIFMIKGMIMFERVELENKNCMYDQDTHTFTHTYTHTQLKAVCLIELLVNVMNQRLLTVLYKQLFVYDFLKSVKFTILTSFSFFKFK